MDEWKSNYRISLHRIFEIIVDFKSGVWVTEHLLLKLKSPSWRTLSADSIPHWATPEFSVPTPTPDHTHHCSHFPQLFCHHSNQDGCLPAVVQNQRMSEFPKNLTAGCVRVHSGQMMVSLEGALAKSRASSPPFSSPNTGTHHSWFVLARGHILFTSSTLKQLHLWVFPPLLCCFLSITSRND